MSRAFLLLLSVACPVLAQPLRFEWKAGEAHSFRVQHDTVITETFPKTPEQTTRTRLTLSKTWTVVSANAGAAELSLSITEMKQEIARAGEETIVLDSSTPDGARAMAAYLNKPILTCTIDVRGRVTDVRGTAGDAAARLQAELPFRVELPEDEAAKWERAFTITLDPPVGTGEKHEASQSFELRKQESGESLIRVTTALKSPPREVAEIQPLLPWLWEGEIRFDASAKRYLGAKLSVSREFKEHQGAGSKFTFESRYEETRLAK